MDKRIEAFINNELSDEEVKQLEEQLRADKQLAEELAFYLSVKKLAAQSPHRTRLEKRHDEWRRLKKESNTKQVWEWRWAAAAVIAIGIGLAWLLKTSSSSDLYALSGKYISANFETLSVRMSGPDRSDSLQNAINAFNGGDARLALAVCEEILRRDPGNTEALKTAGIAALRSEDYDKAIQYFHVLGDDASLYGNPGRFYEALARLQKGGEENIKQAEELLDEVIAKDLEGKKEAEKWRKGD
jgi:tetratricopeptide (TPR) repeat protein